MDAPHSLQMRKPKFFLEDTVALKSDPSRIGVVDVDDPGPSPDTYIRKLACTPRRVLDDFVVSGIPARGFVFVTFADPRYGSSVVPETELTLVDRSLCFGDVVKRNPNNEMSGTVIQSTMTCTLQPVFPGSPFARPHLPEIESEHSRPASPASPGMRTSMSSGMRTPGSSNTSAPGSPGVRRGDAQDDMIASPLNPKSTMLNMVSSEELRLTTDLDMGSYILYQNWLGFVVDVFEEVTVRLSNGSVVCVADPMELEIPMEPHEGTTTLQSNSNGNYWKTIVAERYYPGLYVVTKKGNLRRGRWIFGSYNPSILPEGYIVQARAIEVEVRWLHYNLFSNGTNQAIPAEPPPFLNTDILESDELTIYDKTKHPDKSMSNETTFDPAGGFDYAVGDYVRFKDITGATLKYSSKPNYFKRIPRTETLGYDMNVLRVLSTSSTVTVQWQDKTRTEERSVNLVPYLVVGDEDVWPGELVILKSESKSHDDPEGNGFESVWPQKIGVVQSTNTQERITSIKWFENPRVQLVGQDLQTLMPGSVLGKLSEKEEEISIYDLLTPPALTKRRGDLAFFIPEHIAIVKPDSSEAVRSSMSNGGSGIAPMFDSASESQVHESLGNLVDTARSRFSQPRQSTSQPVSMQPQNHSEVEPGNFLINPIELRNAVLFKTSSFPSLGECFGEIIDLGLDGKVTIRLAAAKPCRDIRIFVDRIYMTIEDDPAEADTDVSDEDEDMTDGYDDEHQSSYEAFSMIPGDRQVKETIEYEGGSRIAGDGEEEDWMTDEESNDEKYLDVHMEDTSISDPPPDEHPSSPLGSSPIAKPSSLEEPLSEFAAHAPPRFLMLDGLPKDHRFLDQTQTLNSQLLRRLHKEHQILESSTPEGIFIRTWEGRMDLLRCLIVGPRNTPYEMAPFVVDFFFGSDFPTGPPKAFFHSWTNGFGRINPNLYEDGKICLSLLNTFPGDGENEKWSTKSTMLQVVVSLMGLVLVKEPFYNEAGFEVLTSLEGSQVSSDQYTEKTFISSKGFVTHALTHLVDGLDDIIIWLYLPRKQDQTPGPQLLRKVIEEAKEAVERSGEGCKEAEAEAEAGKENKIENEKHSFPRISRGGRMLLGRHIGDLEKIWDEEMAKAAVTVTATATDTVTVPAAEAAATGDTTDVPSLSSAPAPEAG
ncbi:MAG: hypothetical protein M1834_009677 [Cirrosporium novae-zelandiae]|nr:MAG: hypothetical protein M1834_009677 [Cirrosporium novae-zelandiae]